jgi:hypothetical protein
MLVTANSRAAEQSKGQPVDIAKLRKRILGHIFQRKVERVENAFASATAPFHAEIQRIEKERAHYEERGEAGSAAWVQTTDDDDGSYDYGEILAERMADELDALLTLRNAFTVLIYHQWERLAQNWAKKGTSAKHNELVSALKTAGIPVNEPGLEALRLLANTLKHNSMKWGRDLYLLRSDLFKSGFDPNSAHPLTGKPSTTIDWEDQIELTDENISEFVGIVRSSSPALY